MLQNGGRVQPSIHYTEGFEYWKNSQQQHLSDSSVNQVQTAS